MCEWWVRSTQHLRKVSGSLPDGCFRDTTLNMFLSQEKLREERSKEYNLFLQEQAQLKGLRRETPPVTSKVMRIISYQTCALMLYSYFFCNNTQRLIIFFSYSFFFFLSLDRFTLQMLTGFLLQLHLCPSALITTHILPPGSTRDPGEMLPRWLNHWIMQKGRGLGVQPIRDEGVGKSIN